jgi:uncharacterized RDD family membrane protein YckC
MSEPHAMTYPYEPSSGYDVDDRPVVALAHWGKRVGAYLIDSIVAALAQFPLWIGYLMVFSDVSEGLTTDPATGAVTSTGQVSGTALALIALGVVSGLVFSVWNICFNGGRTGYTVGKGIIGIKLVKEATGEPIGAGMALLRSFAHVLDALPCYLGFLWPLWDVKRQTFADKVVASVVIDRPRDLR